MSSALLGFPKFGDVLETQTELSEELDCHARLVTNLKKLVPKYTFKRLRTLDRLNNLFLAENLASQTTLSSIFNYFTLNICRHIHRYCLL